MTPDDIATAARLLAEEVSDGQTDPSVTVGTVKVCLRVVDDLSAHPSDSDEYGPADVETFNDGEWRFIGLWAVAHHGRHDLTSSGTWEIDIDRTESDIQVGYLTDLIACELHELSGKVASCK